MATIGRHKAVVDLPFYSFGGYLAWYLDVHSPDGACGIQKSFYGIYELDVELFFIRSRLTHHRRTRRKIPKKEVRYL